MAISKELRDRIKGMTADLRREPARASSASSVRGTGWRSDSNSGSQRRGAAAGRSEEGAFLAGDEGRLPIEHDERAVVQRPLSDDPRDFCRSTADGADFSGNQGFFSGRRSDSQRRIVRVASVQEAAMPTGSAGAKRGGQVESVIAALRERQKILGPAEANDPEESPRCKVAEALCYLENQQSRMRYDEYRRQGLPCVIGLSSSAKLSITASDCAACCVGWRRPSPTVRASPAAASILASFNSWKIRHSWSTPLLKLVRMGLRCDCPTLHHPLPFSPFVC